MEREPRGEHRVTPLELFFDLAFVFAITQVTRLISEDPTPGGLLRGTLVLGALWFGWNVYAWLTSATDVDDGGIRVAMLASTGTMLIVALSVPEAFGRDALLFGVGYLVLRALHVVLSGFIARGDPERRSALVRFAPTALIGPALLVVAAFVPEDLRAPVWVVALAIDYLGPAIIGMGSGWQVAPEHFAERFGLVILIALGESIIAIGVGAPADLDAAAIVAVALGVVVVSALWWLYFDVAAIFVARRLIDADGLERARLARDSYGYLHLPMIGGIVLFAYGLETTLHHLDQPLVGLAAAALSGGVALYLLAHVAFLFRATRYLFRRRTLAAAALLALIPLALVLDAIWTLVLVSVICVLVVAWEGLRHRRARVTLRHGGSEQPRT